MKEKRVWKKAIVFCVLTMLVGTIGVSGMQMQVQQTQPIENETTQNEISDTKIQLQHEYLWGVSEGETTYRVASGSTYLYQSGVRGGNGTIYHIKSIRVKIQGIGNNIGPVTVRLGNSEKTIDGSELSEEGTWVEFTRFFGGIGGCGEIPYPWTITLKAPQASGDSGVGWAYNENYQSYLYEMWGSFEVLWC